MSDDHSTNYIRTFRRTQGFSQEELAHLMGKESGTMISRHEGSGRLPQLDALIAYELVLSVGICELYPSRTRAIRAAIRPRAQQLLRSLSVSPTAARRERTIAVLKRLSERV